MAVAAILKGADGATGFADDNRSAAVLLRLDDDSEAGSSNVRERFFAMAGVASVLTERSFFFASF
jgi:hypothetical protein